MRDSFTTDTAFTPDRSNIHSRKTALSNGKSRKGIPRSRSSPKKSVISRRKIPKKRRIGYGTVRVEASSHAESKQGSPKMYKSKLRGSCSESESSVQSTDPEFSALIDQFDETLSVNQTSEGYRLGGTAANGKLAALARAGRISSRSTSLTSSTSTERKVIDARWQDSVKLLDLQTGDLVEKTVSLPSKEIKQTFALLLRISPAKGHYAPWINKGVFLRYLELGEYSATMLWTLPTPQYRLACLKVISTSAEVVRLIKHFRHMNFFHNGLRLRLLVLNHKVMDAHATEAPFTSILQRHSRVSVQQNKHHGVQSTLGLLDSEILSMPIAQLVDALGDGVVEISEAFACIIRRKRTSKQELSSEAEVYECLRRTLHKEIPNGPFQRAMDILGYTSKR